MVESILTKGIIGVVVGVLAYLYNCFNVLLVVLAFLMVFDYITGVTVGLKSGKFDPKVGWWGAVKKLFYIMIVFTGFLADLTVNYVASRTNMAINTGGALGLAVCLYLIGNEGLSMSKNWVALGLPAPPFLRSAFGFMKDASGRIVKIPKKEDEGEKANV